MLQSVSMVVDAWKEYKLVAEAEQTKREEIWAKRDVAVEQLRTQRELFLQFMTMSFNERSMVFEKQFEALDFAMESGNSEVLNAALNAIVETVKSSPFSSMADMRAKIADTSYTLEMD